MPKHNRIAAPFRRRRLQIFASTDPGVKKIRMAFKKSYQGCLNKVRAARLITR